MALHVDELPQTPTGQNVRITLTYGNESTKNFRFRLDEDIGIDINSDFGELAGNKVNDFFSVLSSSIGLFKDLGISGQHKALGYQIWKGTDPITCSLTLYRHQDADLRYKFNGKVLSPGESLLLFSKEVMEAVVPRESEEGFLFPPGPNVLEALNLTSESSSQGSGFIQTIIDTVTKAKKEQEDDPSKSLTPPRITIQIGQYLLFSKVIVTKLTPTFSSITSEFTSGVDGLSYYSPLYVQFQIEFSTIYIATDVLLDSIINPTV